MTARLHLTLPSKPPTRYQALARAGRRNDARKEAAEQKARATLDLVMHREKGWA
jgi:hypothetical protein